MPKITFFTGASGVGKSTALQKIAQEASEAKILCERFDAQGVPSYEEMVAHYGSPKAWQEHVTYQWIAKIKDKIGQQKHIFLDMQTDLKFIIHGFKLAQLTEYQVILFHCDRMERERRLVHERQQPDLANQDMENWSQHLYHQAKELNAPIIDTTYLNVEEMVERSKAYVV